jgi:UDP-glucose:(heptosyl)LPS alpha-1,3-glucosyltransferase
MSHGLPVVVSGPVHCGISRELKDGQDALLLYDPRDAAGLAKLLSAVIDEPELAATLRQYGLEFARAHTWASAALQYEALYEQASSSSQ